LVKIEIEMMKYNTSFFSTRGSLRFLQNYRAEFPGVDYPNVDTFVAAICGSRQATLKELKYEYTLEEALDLYEVVATQRYNEWLASEYQKRK